MELLQSSIIGKEFINYRKWTMKERRLQFSHATRVQGIGNVPIVVDSVDDEITNALSEKRTSRHKTYGYELVMHMDATLEDVLRDIKIVLLQKNKEDLFKKRDLTIGLEDGSIPSRDTTVGTLYKNYKNKDDKILYLLLSREDTVYGYIVSIIKYICKYLSFKDWRRN